MTARGVILIVLCILLPGGMGCGKKKEQPIQPESAFQCAPSHPSASAGSQGTAEVFMPDPLSSSKDMSLSPSCNHLDNYRVPVVLNRLDGRGVLSGSYVKVLNRLDCNDGFGAFDAHNNFSYSHSDIRFQEAMAYYYGDIYQNTVSRYGYLQNFKPVRIIAHCMLEDNAYFSRGFDAHGNPVEEVCLGDSVSTPGASYGDDASVTVHELQHSTTVDNYSALQYLNQFWYDEAGALNEAVSDFMSLMFTDMMDSPDFSLDFRVFSRWALGKFDSSSHVRGANRCPVYDSNYPDCNQFPSFNTPSGRNNKITISYIYPDGMGWPYADHYNREQRSARRNYLEYSSQEEIHSADVLMLGALWDVYSGIKANHPDHPADVERMMSELVLESVRALPAANLETNHSPVTFIGFASNLMSFLDSVSGITSADKSAVEKALTDRGLIHAPTLTEGWMEVGSGTNVLIPQSSTPGVYIMDDPKTIRKWFAHMLDQPDYSLLDDQVPNSKLDPGEIAAIWFDIQNNQDLSAGGVLVSVTSRDADVTVMNDSLNIGYMNLSEENQSQIMYGKINGKSIMNMLNPPASPITVPLGNSYFKTNPLFNKTWRTAIWVKVSPTAAHGKVVNFEVRSEPSNGVAESQIFSVVIH